MFRVADRRKPRVVRQALVPGVQAEHSEIRRQPSKVAVSDKHGTLAEKDRRPVRENLNIIAIGGRLRKISGSPIYLDCAYFGVRHTQGLDHMLERVCISCCMLECYVLFLNRQKIVEFAFELQPYSYSKHPALLGLRLE
jgi:hypothetical protein